jgi:hypothetical protein
MSSEFPFVEPSKELQPIIGQRIGSSRMYKRMGTEEEMASWFETLTGEIGPAVSPGGVRMYCPVSRAAVHKRIKDGRLSCFTFYTVRHETGLFGQVKDSREKTPYAYIPVSECKAWRTEFLERKTKNDPKLAVELEDAKPDWSGEFMEMESRWQRDQEIAGGPRDVEFMVKLTRKEADEYEKVAKAIGMNSGPELAAMILGDGAKDHMTAINFFKLGAKIARLIEKSGKGVTQWQKLFKWS